MNNRIVVGTFALGLLSVALGYWTAPRTPLETLDPSPSRAVWRQAANPGDDALSQPPRAASLTAARDPEEFRSLLQSILSEDPDDPDRDDWLMATIARWIDLHSIEAIAELNEWPDGSLRSWIVDHQRFLLHRLALIDLDGAMRLAEKSRLSLTEFAPVILARYPERLPELLKANRFRATPRDWRRAGKVLADQGLPGFAILESWLQLRSGSRRDYADTLFGSFAAELASSDPEALLAWADKLDGIPRRSGNANQDFLSAGDAVRMAVIRELQESDPERARSLAANGPLREAFMAELAGEDLDRAVDWLFEANDAPPSRQQLDALLPHLDHLSVLEALPYLERFESLFDLAKHDSFLLSTAIAETRGAAQLPKLAEQLAALPPSPTRDSLLAGTLAAWASHDSEAAQEHALTVLRNGTDPLLATVLARTIARHPARVMEFADFLPENARAGFLRKTALRAVSMNVRPFAEAVAGRIAEPGAEDAAAALIEFWGHHGTRAPAEWLDALPAGGAKDAGIVQFVTHVRDADLETALQWAQSARGESARLSALQTSLHPLAVRDPEAAVETVERLSLSVSERGALLEFIERPPPLLEP